MTSVAKLFLESTQITEYDELKTALIEEFAKEYNSAEVHKKLSERVKKNTESFHEYLLHMRKIASLSDIEETSIDRYVVDGLRIKSEIKHLLYRCKTYKSLQEEYEIFEHFIKDER
ncbi:uncharacterized protein LOC128869458 [Anastrepha ludens]|uniref:uncharacterized protein LOC128869458 n=1 Tax=Anastrepha ludens TaxID=28586 RepID=UPI0023B00F62|nr:uncharacterized protein LOC128869458 [Anastrepha ludens]